jgi:aldehyde:ferredoxin oxidoreductase
MEDYWKTAERIYTMERSYNIREGFTRADDYLPARAWEPLTYGPKKGAKLIPEGFYKELDDLDLKYNYQTHYHYQFDNLFHQEYQFV